MTGKTIKVMNVLEFISAIILLADFGESSSLDLQHNAELIEHKINLMLLLFDIRKLGEVNIAEIIIMLKTALQALSRVFPVQFFKNQDVINEIKFVMMGLFKERLEKGVSEIYGTTDISKGMSSPAQRKQQQKDAKNESDFLGYVKSSSPMIG